MSLVPRWDLFVAFTFLLVVVMVGLARATQKTLALEADDGGGDGTVGRRPREDDPDLGATVAIESMDTPLLLVNVSLSHGLLGVVLLVAIWYTQVPPPALGVSTPAPDTLLTGLLVGAVLYAGNELGAAAVDRAGYQYDERLREVLAPETVGGWTVLLVVVLPLIAAVEELLFRGAIIGGLAAAYGLPEWGLAVVSSALFGYGHGLQGTAGVIVTAVLGFVLAAVFIATQSLLVVIVAHYVVNALEFVVHEGIGADLQPL